MNYTWKNICKAKVGRYTATVQARFDEEGTICGLPVVFHHDSTQRALKNTVTNAHDIFYEGYARIALYNDLDDPNKLDESTINIFKIKCVIIEGVSRPLEEHEYAAHVITQDRMMSYIKDRIYPLLEDNYKLIGGQR